MANVISITSTWTSKYLPEIFLTPTIETNGVFNDNIYTVDPAVKTKWTKSRGSELKYILQKKANCGFNPIGEFNLTEFSLETVPMAINIEQCANTFAATVFKETLKTGSNVYDLTDTLIGDTIAANAAKAVTKDSFAASWFGDTATSSTGYSGFLTAFNGWFKQFDGDANVDKSVTIGTTGDYALNALREMYTTNELLAQREENTVFMVTPDVYYNLQKTYEQLGTDSGLTALQDGKPQLAFRGIPVLKQSVWQEVIADFSLGNTSRIVWTTRGNLYVGTDITNPGTDAKVFVDDLTEKFYFKTNFDLGVTYEHPELISYAKSA